MTYNSKVLKKSDRNYTFLCLGFNLLQNKEHYGRGNVFHDKDSSFQEKYFMSVYDYMIFKIYKYLVGKLFTFILLYTKEKLFNEINTV